MRRTLLVVTVLGLLVAGCGWARPRFDGGNTGNNPLELSISRDNVATLHETFRVSSPGFANAPSFAVARGHLYVDGGPTRVFDSVGVDGCSGSPRVCQPQWTIDGNEPPDVIDATLHVGAGAFDADGVQECGGAPKVCDPLWYDFTANMPTGVTDPTQMHFQTGGPPEHGAEDVYLFGYRNPKPADCTAPAGEIPFCSAVWTHYLGGGPLGGRVGMAAVAAGRVFASYSSVVSPTGTLYAFDGRDATGPLLWSARLPGKGGPTIAVADGVVVTTADTATGSVLAAYDAAGVKNCTGSPKVCTPLWVSDTWTGAGSDAAPAIANGIVYRAVGTQLRAYDLHGVAGCAGAPVGCQKQWVAEVGPGVNAPAVGNGVVYVTADDGTLQAYDARGTTSCSATTRVCAPLWDTNLGSAGGSVEVAAGRVYASALDGTVRAFALP